MKKRFTKTLSLLLSAAILLSAFLTAVPTFAAVDEADTSSAESIIADFENSENPFPVIWNVYSGKAHPSVDSQYIGLSSETEALNGNASLKLNIPSGNSRTEAAFAEPKLNSSSTDDIDRYITSSSDASGIMLRLKINNEASTEGHNFAILLNQTGAPAKTHLAKDAVLYDLKGNATTPTSSALSMTIPSNFDGFIYLPFASARANCDADLNKYYDDYVNNPESMVDITKAYSMTILFGKWGGGDTSWDNTEVLVDDVCVIGSAEGAVWDAMRAFGYTDVLHSAQPEKYTLPITHENLWQPISSLTATTNSAATDFTYTANASLTNNANEVLLGDISAKLSTETTYSGDAAGVIETIKTNTFTVAGIEALSTDKITTAASDDYAYFKMRIKVPENENGDTYNFLPAIKQNSKYYFFALNGIAYNVDGTKNSTVTFNANAQINLPSGFDGYLYMPVYRLRNAKNSVLTSAYTGAYINGATTPELDSDFDMFLYFKQNNYNLDNFNIYIDNIEFVFGDTDKGQLPFTFDEMVYTRPTAEGKDEKQWKVRNLNDIIKFTVDKDALNGKASLKLNPKGNYNESVYYNYNAAIFNNINPITDTSISGVMLRLKLLNDTTTGTGTKAHSMQLVLVQDSHADTCIGGNLTKIFDINGKPLPSSDYATSDTNVFIPIGFDGFIFFPLSENARRDGKSTSAFVDTTAAFSLQVWFASPELWDGVSAVIDDISYYTVADSTAGLTETDALNAMNARGYTTKWAEQPDAYDLSLDFEDYMLPFDTCISKYGQLNKDNIYPEVATDAQFVTGSEALSGNVSVKYSFARDEAIEAEGRNYVRALTSMSRFNGIDGLDKESIANNAENYAYLTMRIKVPDTNESGYSFNVYAKQEYNDKLPSTRLRAEYGYTVDGEYVEFKVSDGVCTLPAGFNGTIYMPIKKSTSTKTLTTGMRATYGNSFTQEDGTVLYGNDYMVDFSSEFVMYLYLGDNTWADTELYIDDIMIKSFKASDFDNSGSTNAVDVLTLSRYVLGVDTVQKDAFDLNKDGDIDVGDVVRIKRIIAGLVEG